MTVPRDILPEIGGGFNFVGADGVSALQPVEIDETKVFQSLFSGQDRLFLITPSNDSEVLPVYAVKEVDHPLYPEGLFVPGSIFLASHLFLHRREIGKDTEHTMLFAYIEPPSVGRVSVSSQLDGVNIHEFPIVGLTEL